MVRRWVLDWEVSLDLVYFIFGVLYYILQSGISFNFYTNLSFASNIQVSRVEERRLYLLSSTEDE